MTVRCRVASAAERDAAFNLRHEIFTVGQGVPPSLERDNADADAIHVVALDGEDRVVGTGRLVDEGDHARLGRIAVDETLQGRGIGRLVVSELEDQAARVGLTTARLHAQEPVVDFYRGLGYLAYGDPDVEAGIRHRWMTKELFPGLRAVEDSDSPGLISLIGDIWESYPGIILDVDGEEPWLRAPSSAYRKYAGVMWVVGEAARGPLTGCIGVRPTSTASDADGVELKSLYVSASARRQGLGSRLVAVVERHARLSGATLVTLWSDSRFTEAHEFYTRLGYRSTGSKRALHDRSDTVEWEFTKHLR